MEPTSNTPGEERSDELAGAPVDTTQPEPAPDVPSTEAPASAVPAPADVLPPAPEPPAPSPLDLGDEAPPAAQAPDLSAVDAPAPSGPTLGTNMDLPSLVLPNPVPPAAPTPPPAPSTPAPGTPGTPSATGASGAGYTEHLARQSYGEPSASPEPAPYADTPYAAAPGAGAGYAEPAYAEPQYSQPQYSQPLYGQQPAGQAYGQMVPAAQLSPAEESTWAGAAHWSSLVASLIGLPFLGPLLVLLVQGQKSPRVRANAVESLNFDLTMLIAMLVSSVLTLVLIGFLLIPVVAVLWLAFKIVATIQTSAGHDYRYPLNIRMVK